MWWIVGALGLLVLFLITYVAFGMHVRKQVELEQEKRREDMRRIYKQD